MYDPSLIEKPSILVLNKMDTENSTQKFDEFMKLYDNYESIYLRHFSTGYFIIIWVKLY